MRIGWAVALIVTVSCGKSERQAAEDERAGDSPAESSQTAPAGLALTMGDQSMAMRTVLLVEDPVADPRKRTNKVEVYDVAAEQFACGAVRLYKPRATVVLATRAPFEPKTVLRSGADQANKAWVYNWNVADARQPEGDEAIEVRIDTVNREQQTATGSLSASVGDASLNGPFEAILCPTRIGARDRAEPIHGMQWTTDEVAPRSIPSEPAQGFVVDGPFAIAHANARRWQKDGEDMWRVTFFRAKPEDPCAHRHDGFIGSGADGTIRRSGVASDWFAVSGPAKTIGSGKSLTSRILRKERDGDWRASAGWMEPGEQNGVSFAQYGNVSLAVQSLTAEAMKGRIYIALPYDPKPLLVGSFDAVVCGD